VSTNLFGLERPALEALFEDSGEPRYRARQLYVWLYQKRARSLAAMTNLSKPLRDRLANKFALRWPEVAERQRSTDGTVKLLFQLDGGATIESVYIPEARRRTICISTQAGCPLKCAFCLTGIAGYQRNLKPWEILGQVATVMAEAAALDPAGAPDRAWNVVVMGMGEPLLNYDATVCSLRILMDPDGFAITSSIRYLSSIGISSRRREELGACRLIARLGRTGSAINFSRAGRIPTVESVSRLGVIAKPSGSIRMRSEQTVAS
jgi:23S rRNA (adenine2503-C2)-methyltransferase